MFIGIINADFQEFTRLAFGVFFNIYQAINVRCIGGTARNNAGLAHRIDQYLLFSADFSLQPLHADSRLCFHEALQPFLLCIFIHRIRQLIGPGAFNR